VLHIYIYIYDISHLRVNVSLYWLDDVNEIRYSKMVQVKVKVKVGHFVRCLGRQRVEVVTSNPFAIRG
jgi:hypothetical protein